MRPTIRLRIDDELLKQFDYKLCTEGRNRSVIIRMLIELYVKSGYDVLRINED